MTIYRDGVDENSYKLEKASYPKGPPPYNLKVMKGPRSVILSKRFANFIMTHPVATDFFHWIEVTYIGYL